MAEAVIGSVGGLDSPFEEAVAAALTSRGWQVHTQAGVSVFRIDLGVVDPDAPCRFLAGVECAGAKASTGKPRQAKVNKNPYTGEIVETKGGNHKKLKEWKADHSSDIVESWLTK